jgi:hypothetical protein
LRQWLGVKDVSLIDPDRFRTGKLNATQPEVSIVSNPYIRRAEASGKAGLEARVGVAVAQHPPTNGKSRLSTG